MTAHAEFRNLLEACARWRPLRSRYLFGGDTIAIIGHRLDAILDVAQRAKRGPDRIFRQVLHHVGCNRIAQAVEIVHQAAARSR